MNFSICRVQERIMSAGVALEIDEMLSKNHRMVESGRDLWRASGSTLPAQAGPPGDGSPGPHPDSFWGSPRRENPIFSGRPVPVLSYPHTEKSVSWCSDRASCVSCYAHCLLSCHRPPLETGCLCPLCTVYFLYTLMGLPGPFSSPGRAVPAQSAFPQMWSAPNPSSYLWSSPGSFQYVQSVPGVASLVLSNTHSSSNTFNAAQDTVSCLWLWLFFSFSFSYAAFSVEYTVQKVFEWEESEVNVFLAGTEKIP